LEKFRIKYRLSTLYHLQTNGLVERFNQTLCKKLAKIVKEMTMWNEFIDSALMIYHMTKHAIMKVILFLLVYNRKVILLIDKSYDLCMRDRMMQIMKEVPHIREEAWCIIQHFQQHMIENDTKKEKLF